MSPTSDHYVEKSWDALAFLSLATGITLVTAGVTRRSPWGSLAAAVGGALLYRSALRNAPSPADRRPTFARGVKMRGSIVIEDSPEQCYRYWRDLGNLPRFINHLDSVEVISDRRSRWVMKTMAGGVISWDAEITRDIPDEMIGWRSLPGSQVDTAGSLRFEKAGWNRTRVVVTMKYNPPAGMLGSAIMELFGAAPQQQLADDLLRFKQAIEEKAAQRKSA